MAATSISELNLLNRLVAFVLLVILTTATTSFGQDGEIAIWVKAFIPKEITGLTKVVPAGEHKDKTMIPGPTLVNDCFLTDQRTFSSDPAAKARMTSVLVVKREGNNVSIDQKQSCSPTIEIDCEDGDVECNKTAATDHMKFALMSNELVDGKATITMNCAANNPCFRGSPDIDYEGTFTIDYTNKKIEFKGKVEPFPAYEIYAKGSSGTKAMLQKLPKEGATPANLFGSANQPVDVTIDIP